MNITFDRGLLTHSVIAIGVCVGAWMMLVQPRSKGLLAAEAALVASAKSLQDVNESSFQKTVERMKEIRTRVAQIEGCNNLMHDSSRLYGRIMDLAAHHGVTIQNLQPGSEKLSADGKMSTYRIDVNVEGRYEQIAGFLEAIGGIDGFIRPVSLNVVPMHDASNPTVTARFSCEAISFKLPENLAAVGGEHAKP